MPSTPPPTKNPAFRIYRKVRRMLRDRARKRLRTQVAFTAPSPPANRDVPFSPHELVCHQDVLLAICSAKSLNLAMGEALPWIFHEDGSLTAEDHALLLRQFPGTRVVKRTEADAFFDQARATYPLLHELRKKHVMLLKLADLGAFSARDRILYVDSDILFFRPPAFIMEKLRQPGAGNFFNRDIDSAYIVAPQVIEQLTGIPPPTRINAGLSILNRADIQLAQIEDMLNRLHPSKRTDWVYYGHLIEQTVVSLLTASSPTGAHHLPEDYDVSLDRPAKGAVSKHYVGVIRHLFEIEGLDLLLREYSFEERWAQFAKGSQKAA
jgi:hypothetical protein